jgi:type I restriction enzyme S subunit
MRWLSTILGNVITLEYGKALPRSIRNENGGIAVAGSNGEDGRHDVPLVSGPGIVVGRKGSAGKVTWFHSDFWPIDTTYFVRHDPQITNLRWLYYLLISKRLERLNKTTGVPGLNRNDVYEDRCFLPPLPEQHRIVEILDEADRLRRLRHEADAKAARILPALFLKMFGDPATNPMGWPLSRIRDLAIKYSDGPFGSNLKSDHYVPNGMRVIRLQNIGVGQLIDTDRAFISFEHFNSISKHECRPGDVLIGTLGDPNLRACIQPEDISIALNKADCVQLRVKPEKATREFVCWLLNMPGTLALAQSLVLGQTRSRISMGRLGELPVPVPPLELQQEFSHKVQVVNSTLAKADSASGKIEGLFSMLMQRAFSGQLTVKWRAAHSKELLAEMEQQARLLNLSLPKELEIML